MGDFNLDLLKTSGDNAASKFYNNLTSHFFTPYILQPTRLRSKTLIDNIFFNSLDRWGCDMFVYLELGCPDNTTPFGYKAFRCPLQAATSYTTLISVTICSLIFFICDFRQIKNI